MSALKTLHFEMSTAFMVPERYSRRPRCYTVAVKCATKDRRTNASAWLGEVTLVKIHRQVADALLPASSPRHEPVEDEYSLCSSPLDDSRRPACAPRAPGYALCHESAFIGPTHAAFFLACLFFVPK
jgi:hypothetical protein